MKKALLIAAVAGFVLASCKKDYTCECTTKDSSDPSFNSSVSYTTKSKKKDAEDWCGKYKATAGTLTTECKIK